MARTSSAQVRRIGALGRVAQIANGVDRETQREEVLHARVHAAAGVRRIALLQVGDDPEAPARGTEQARAEVRGRRGGVRAHFAFLR